MTPTQPKRKPANTRKPQTLSDLEQQTQAILERYVTTTHIMLGYADLAREQWKDYERHKAALERARARAKAKGS